MTNAIILWITILSGPMDGMAFGVPYETMEACLSAKSHVSGTLDYDHNMTCKEVTE